MIKTAKIINPNALHMVDCNVGDELPIVRTYADGCNFYYIVLSESGKEIPVSQYYCQLIIKGDEAP